MTVWTRLPVGIFFGIVAAEAKVEVLADVAVDPTAHDETLTVVTGVLHINHLVIVFVPLWLGTTFNRKMKTGRDDYYRWYYITVIRKSSSVLSTDSMDSMVRLDNLDGLKLNIVQYGLTLIFNRMYIIR